MKATLAVSFARNIATFVLISTITTASAQVSTNSSLSLAYTNGGTASLSVSNSGDQVWMIQTSSDLKHWTTLESVKVFNGAYHRTYTNTTNGNIFYRAWYSASNQNIADVTSNTLSLPATSYNYAAEVLPASFSVAAITAEDNTPGNNPITDAGATLGRVLFYDKRLSTNQTVACASCHQQAAAFSDPRAVSIGFNGSKGTRNAMGLNNARWYERKKFFWDERSATLEAQTLQPIQNPIEMGMTLATLTNRLAAEPYYTNLFQQAFGSPVITTNGISFALAQFVRSIVSTQSKYDIGETNNFANFTTQENLGRQLFFGLTGNPRPTCSVCHITDNFVPTTTLNNNGLEYPYVDLGVGGVTSNSAQYGLFSRPLKKPCFEKLTIKIIGVFAGFSCQKRVFQQPVKVPSLRNIALTGPYMHDGRFTNLAQVVTFYDSGIVNNPNLSPPLVGPGGTPLRLNLTSDQQAALVAFLNTLTDTNVVTDPKWSDPFNYGN